MGNKVGGFYVGETVVYGKPNCSQCDEAVGYLKGEGIEHRYINAMGNQSAMAFIRDSGAMSFPVVSLPDGSVVSGNVKSKLEQYFRG